MMMVKVCDHDSSTEDLEVSTVSAITEVSIDTHKTDDIDFIQLNRK